MLVHVGYKGSQIKTKLSSYEVSKSPRVFGHTKSYDKTILMRGLSCSSFDKGGKLKHSSSEH